jgi:hypothetical protein
MTGMTLLTQALALTKPQTDPTGPCGRFRQCACTGDDGPCDDCKGSCVCGYSYADHLRGFGSKQQQLGAGVKRVPRK